MIYFSQHVLIEPKLQMLCDTSTRDTSRRIFTCGRIFKFVIFKLLVLVHRLHLGFGIPNPKCNCLIGSCYIATGLVIWHVLPDFGFSGLQEHGPFQTGLSAPIVKKWTPVGINRNLFVLCTV